VTKKAPAGFSSAAVAGSHAGSFPRAKPDAHGKISDYLSLTKPRLNLLVVLTAAVGYYLAAAPALEAMPWLLATLGTALVAGGAAGLNQVYERDTDRLMWRTRTRPVAADRLSSREAAIFSLALSAAGLTLLALRANWIAAALAVLTLVSYNVIYTPMKRRSQLATLVGAVPGALPPMIGWAAARGSVTAPAWALFAIVFVWQIPHFMAIAWLYREDFGRAGFPLLPVVHPDGKSTARQAVLFSAMLIPVAVIPFLLQMAGLIYLIGALLGGTAMVAASIAFAADCTNERARRLFFGSIIYLPVLWILLIADRF